MRILSVATLVSPGGEYGGPTRVAVNQVRELRRLGHDVTLCAGTRGFETAPSVLDGDVPVTLFPAHQTVPGTGFAGLTSPTLWRWLWQHIGEYDVCHIHLARDLVTLPATAIARARGVRFVVQTHGMIDPTRRLLAVPLDAVLTRPALRSARAVLYLTPVEREGLAAVAGPSLRLVELLNGVPSADPAAPSDPREVLYLARLAGRKRPGAFVATAARLGSEFPDVRFALVGPDEGEGDAVKAAIAAAGPGDRLAWEGPLAPEHTLDRLRQATVYVLPSVDEPYPMSVLEAMSVGLPVVITDTCGLAGIVRESGAGLVVGPAQEELDEAVRRLLADRDGAEDMGRRGRAYVRENLGMEALARRLLGVYSGQATSGAGASS